MKQFCIYCGEKDATSLDHIPPKCLFLRPCPNVARITVPCCEPCRRRDETNDALVRNILISTREAEPHHAVQGQLAGARNRSFYHPSQLRAVLQHMTQADVHSAGGIYLGSAPAFDFGSSVMDGFLHRVTRALLHEEQKCGFVPSTIEWRVNPAPDVCHDLAREGRSRVVGDVFSYSALFLEGHLNSIWLLTFYESLRFVVHLQLTRT